MVLALAYYAFIVVGVAWFWLHCAEPELRYQRAGVRARRVVLGLTLLSIGVNAFDAVITASRLAVPGLWWVTTITGALWILVVGLGYLQRYRFLIQATGSV